MRKAWPGASTSSAYLSRGSTCTRGGPRPLPQSGLGGFESAGVDKKRSAATHGRREAQHHPERAWGDTSGWTQSWWSPRRGPGRTPLDGRGLSGHPRWALEDTPGWMWSWWSPRGGPGRGLWMGVVMVVTQERAGTVDGRGHGGHPRGAQEDAPGWTWSWWSPRKGPGRTPPGGRGHGGHPGEGPGGDCGWMWS